MITANLTLINYIKSQKSLQEFANKSGVSLRTVYTIIDGKQISADVIAKILTVTGMDFEKAFEVDGGKD